MRPLHAACAVAAAVGGAAAASFCDPGDGWVQDWVEEFDGDSLDPATWNIHDDNEVGSCREAWCTPRNVQVANGTLILTSKMEQYKGFNYTTGAVYTQGKRAWTGNSTSSFRLCVSAKLPGGGVDAGQGIWPAHWMMPNTPGCWPDLGEMDILEMIDGDGLAQGTYHWESTYPAANCSYPKGHLSVHGSLAIPGWATGFNEYAIERGNAHVAYVYNGLTIGNFSATGQQGDPKLWPVPWYLILNTAIGGPWPGPPNASTIFPATHVIDSVRVSTLATPLGA